MRAVAARYTRYTLRDAAMREEAARLKAEENAARKRELAAENAAHSERLANATVAIDAKLT